MKISVNTFSVLLINFLILIQVQAFSQQIHSDLEFSLLTCASGEEIYAAFGHSAIRVKELNKHKDIVFDFGVFDFNEPNFVLKFIRGNLKYRLSISDYEDFIAMYKDQGREVMEERLNLTEDETKKVLAMLMYHYLPENRYYYYNFLFDNCSTRIRDLVDTLGAFYIPENAINAPTSSFRENLEQYLQELPWMKFGIDIVLGSRIDRTMSFRDQMFLPINLSQNLRQYRRYGENSELLSQPRILIENKIFETKPRKDYFTPFNILSILLIIILILTWTHPRITKPLGIAIFTLIGIQGVILLILWTGTTHYATKANWNILWVNPFYLLMIFSYPQFFKNILFSTLILCDVFILATWNFLPQELNIAAIPLLGILIFLKARIWYMDYRAKTGRNLII